MGEPHRLALYGRMDVTTSPEASLLTADGHRVFPGDRRSAPYALAGSSLASVAAVRLPRIPPYGILRGGLQTISGADSLEGPMYGYTMKKKELQDRLRRIEGQVRGLQRMVDEDKYCIDILTQINSVSAALKAVGMGLLDDHVRHCVRQSLEKGEGDEKVEELVSAVARFVGR